MKMCVRTGTKMLAVGAAAVLGLSGPAVAQTPATNFMTYQGKLQSGGQPYTGTADITIRVYNSDVGGPAIGLTNCWDNVQVQEGLFTLTFHPGAVFDGRALWLEIDVREDATVGNGCTGVFTTLFPRQRLTAAPLASALVLPASELVDVAGQPAFSITNASNTAGSGGVRGQATGSGAGSRGVDGVYNGTGRGFGVVGSSVFSTDLFSAGVLGSGSLVGVEGTAQAAGGVGVKASLSGAALTSNSISVYGVNGSTGTNARGVQGQMTAATPGLFAAGVYGMIESAAASTGVGVQGLHNGTGYGVRGSSANDIGVAGDGRAGGVLGYALTNTAATFGVRGTNNNANGVGVQGEHNATTGTAPGVWGTTDSTSGDAVGVLGEVVPLAPGSFSAGVKGLNRGTGGSGVGVYARHDGGGYGLYASVPTTGSGHAGWFAGRVQVTGALNVSGTLTKGSGAFKIDHPLDPENKYLYHSFVESPDMMNIYNGVATTDEKGYATVTMPDWFQALNRDFRYQLTVIDSADSDDFVLAKVVGEIEGNRFTLRASKGGVRVSWQVTGIRNDAFARDQRIPTEVLKSESERGMFLYPQGFGFGEERRLGRSQVDEAVGQ